MTTDSAPVTVAVVSWNTRDLLARCLRSLLAESEAGRAAVWVVDNASTDGSADLVRGEFPWVSLIPSHRNVGFGRAVNLVAARTSSSWLIPANADIELPAGSLEVLLKVGDAHPEAGIIAPRLLLPDGSTQPSTWRFPSLRGTAVVNAGAHRLSSTIGRRLSLEGWQPDTECDVDWAMGAFLLVRRSAFDAVRGFDADQWMYAEDLDLGWRLDRAGWRTRYVPAAEVRHWGGASAVQAFGNAGAPVEKVAASYRWLAKRRGRAVMWATVALDAAGAAIRLALLIPLTALFPGRWRAARNRVRGRLWVTIQALRCRAPGRGL